MCGGAKDDQSGLDNDNDNDNGETPALDAEEEKETEIVAPWLSAIESSGENQPGSQSPVTLVLPGTSVDA
ncbi:hypothetical protein PHISCL_08220 [Aspergillus sclerotialis]|uniref:Uncharacterized protein n=1 Tax=Aspergillus sclerotialis TaxID=2070753 RepID=A0A3A2ZB21_9EURO|nr:hypothetical protein PHISCL_08220 [Aspergillus sclerotialis]